MVGKKLDKPVVVLNALTDVVYVVADGTPLTVAIEPDTTDRVVNTAVVLVRTS